MTIYFNSYYTLELARLFFNKILAELSQNTQLKYTGVMPIFSIEATSRVECVSLLR